MTARTQHARALPPTWRWRALLVLGVLVGLLGMHGLGLGGAAVMAAHDSSHEQRTSATALADEPDESAESDESVCHQCGGGHAQHSDPTCASGAVTAGYVPSAPLADPVGFARTTGTVDRYVVASPDGGRAPPSLAELQLLRI